ncbi:MAG: DUF58 domain-containing protein [Kiritimatiellae bacterium]|nr:DUF58 domain-containing protein [Kiritimatiellia bacterium]
MTEAEQQGLADGIAVRFLIPRRARRGGPGSDAAPRAGESLEFQDYRDYTPGDDLRNLDWNVLARSDREVIKVHREEVAPVIELFRDRSASMAVPPAKRDTADYLFGLVTASADGCRVVEREEPQTPRAVRIMLSDLMTDLDPERAIARLSHLAAAVIVIRILAASETAPATGGSGELIDSETGERRELPLDRETVSAYLNALAAHTARWRAAARRFNATFIDLPAEAPHSAIIRELAAAGILEGRR